MAALTHLTSAAYSVSRWSGGTTTQLTIFPPEASYADREFLWRVSSATVDLEESDFTILRDYDRWISTLRGEIVLTHAEAEPLRLRPYEVHGFSGAEETHCVGRCTDFNLMLRRGRAEGAMEALCVGRAPVTIPADPKFHQCLLYCAEGCCTVSAEEETRKLQPGETVLASPDCLITLRSESEKCRLMVCRMRRIEE